MVLPYAATGPLELVVYLATELALPLYSFDAAVSLVARRSAKPCCQATFTEADVAQARVDRQKFLNLGEQAKHQLACGTRARRRWRTMRDGPPTAKMARRGHPPLSLRQLLAGLIGLMAVL